MKLELRNKILQYLPYNLMIVNLVGKEIELTCMDLSWHLEKGFKPILRPITFFEKMIVKDIKDFLDCSHEQVMEVFGFMDGEIKVEKLSYGTFTKLAVKHIDLFDLIPNGLAIEKNHSPV